MSMIGTTLGMYSTSSGFNFFELMAYSQEAIQMNAGVIVSFIGTNNDPFYLVSNAITNIVILDVT